MSSTCEPKSIDVKSKDVLDFYVCPPEKTSANHGISIHERYLPGEKLAKSVFTEAPTVEPTPEPTAEPTPEPTVVPMENRR